jgi:hypothetical protein
MQSFYLGAESFALSRRRIRIFIALGSVLPLFTELPSAKVFSETGILVYGVLEN